MTTQKQRLEIAKDFSREPLGRYPTDSDFNGQRFREEFLFPSLSAHEHVTVVLDGTEGYGSSFLEEAFGGLVRVHRLTQSELAKRLSVVSDEDETLKIEIDQYIAEAKPGESR